MNKMHKVEVELTDDEAERLRGIFERGDEDEIAAEIERVERLASLRLAARELREAMMRDVIMNAHYWLHEKQPDKALMLLCPMVSILEGDTPPAEVVKALSAALNEGNLLRAKESCEGNA